MGRWADQENDNRKCRGGMSRTRARLRPRSEHGHNGPCRTKENMMAKYLLLKHYRGGPAAVNDVPMDQWTPEEVSAHVQYMRDFAARLEGTGEFVDTQALSPEGTFVRHDGEGRPPVTDGPFVETKDLIAGWMVIDVETYERAIELAGELSAAPGAGGGPGPGAGAGSRSTSGSRSARSWARIRRASRSDTGWMSPCCGPSPPP